MIDGEKDKDRAAPEGPFITGGLEEGFPSMLSKKDMSYQRTCNYAEVPTRLG